jgi:hypothetical protein
MSQPRFVSLEEPAGRRRLRPWILLSLPFFCLLVLVLALVSRGDFGARLARVGAIERQHTELYAIEKTPSSSVALILAALERPEAERSAAESWAVGDLLQRAGRSDRPGDPRAFELLQRFAQRWRPAASSPAPAAVQPAVEPAPEQPAPALDAKSDQTSNS